jgi:hypothetical protein
MQECSGATQIPAKVLQSCPFRDRVATLTCKN